MVNFINDTKILIAHRYLKANRTFKMGLFLHQLTVQGVGSPSPVHWLPTIAVSVFFRGMRESTQQLSY